MSLKLEWVDERNKERASGEENWQPLLQKLLELAGAAEDVKSGTVTLTLTDNAGIQVLNKEYRGLDKPTDVLSFPLMGGDEDDITYDGEFETEIVEVEGDWEDDESEEADSDEDQEEIDPFEELLGDIVISTERLYEQADEYGHSPERELGFLFVHGFLHLIGYDHADEAAEKHMFSRQEAVLEKAGLTR